MKILYIQETDWLNKGPQQQHHLLERLSNKGHHIIVLDYEIRWKEKKSKKLISRKFYKKVPPKAFSSSNIHLIRPTFLRIPFLNYLSILPTYGMEIFHLIRKFQPDMVVGNGILTVALGCYLANKKNIPFIYLMVDKIHQLIPNRFFRLFGFALEQYIHRKAKKIIVINEQLKDYSIRMKANPESTYVLRAGVEIELFKEDLEIRRKMRDKYAYKDEDIVLFFMGWLYIFSGLKEVLLKLFEMKNPKIKLFILGTGDLKVELIDLRKKLKLHKLVTIHEWIPYRDLPKYISIADVCLLPSYQNKIMNEIVPIKLYEYLAMNKPVISTLLNGIYREFRRGNGVVYIKSSEEAVEKALQLKNKNLINKLGIQGRKFVERNCDWQKIINDFIRITSS